jgi:hypothetical protein
VAQNPHSALDIGAGCVGDLGVTHKYSGEYFVGNAPGWSQRELATLYVMRSMHFFALQAEKLHACCGYLLFQAALERALSLISSNCSRIGGVLEVNSGSQESDTW